VSEVARQRMPVSKWIVSSVYTAGSTSNDSLLAAGHVGPRSAIPASPCAASRYNALLFDRVRTLARILRRARKSFDVGFRDRTRRVADATGFPELAEVILDAIRGEPDLLGQGVPGQRRILDLAGERSS